MVKTREDFLPEAPTWLIDNFFPLGHRGMDTAPEGGYKTVNGSWMGVCIAAGIPYFGHRTYQGPVVFLNEEIPGEDLDFIIDRFCRGIGRDRKKLPIYTFSMLGYRFERAKMIEFSKIVDAINPVLIRIDSLLTMLPSGRQRVSENSDMLGELIRDELNRLLHPGRSILMAAHGKKQVANLTLEEVQEQEMQSMVRGHGSIVGEGCDTGYVLKKISEGFQQSRFCLMTRPRRKAIPASKPKFIEMVEQGHGSGWARLEEIPMSKLPPSPLAKEVYKIFKIPDGRGNFNHPTKWIKSTCALLSTKECRVGLYELLGRHAIVETGPQDFELNQKRFSQCDAEYLGALEAK